ncbi:ER lumen protein retaining receptor [Platanthera zijinensis]|uniref:ER lumen protein retaining receptor n=1 Tax=Platanthera zijinensis TaxID=2320716 RepID=A0AAP0AZB7_9ASPA
MDAASGAWAETPGRQTLRKTAAIGIAAAAAVLLLLCVFINDSGYIFILSEVFHATGISVLIYKLTKDRSCAGLSLKSQELTALFLSLRLFFNYRMSFDIHGVLDIATLITTLWVIYMIRVILKSSYMEDEDSFPLKYLVMACALLALFAHPKSSDNLVNRLMFAFGCNLETVAIMPQLRLMHNTKIVESLAAYYVFSLGVTRFLNTAHWIIQVVSSHGTILFGLVYGIWPAVVFISEIVQTLMLGDFCYYYIKSIVKGHSVLRLPSDSV